MQCTCEIECDYDSISTVYSEEIRTAKKQHKCSECHRVIEPCEKYEHVTGLWDGEWSKYKTCSDCLSLRNVFFKNGWGFQELWSDFKDAFGYPGDVIPESCISKLTPVARARVCEIIENGWDQDEE